MYVNGGSIIFWWFKPFLGIGLRVYNRIYLAAYGPENKGGFGLEKRTKTVCGLGRTNYGSLRNV